MVHNDRNNESYLHPAKNCGKSVNILALLLML